MKKNYKTLMAMGLCSLFLLNVGVVTTANMNSEITIISDSGEIEVLKDGVRLRYK